jgi:tetratricopeptide (TPR) repeat protein
MNKTLKTLTAVFLAIAAVSCASPDKMAKLADNVKVSCNPSVLEVVNDQILATVTVDCPKDYFNPKVIMEVTPVIVYEGGEAAMKPFKYQGDKVKDNYKVVSSQGQKITEQLKFDYVEGMEKCFLELRSRVIAGNKSIALPSKKVADGANTTYMLVKRQGDLSFKKDAYKDILTSTTEGQIKYLVNSSEVRNSELKGDSVMDFLAALESIAKDERATITGTEIVAYASPEGAEDRNNKLSGDRSASANKAWDKVTKGLDTTDPSVRSVGEDWEGFQQLVAESNIEDKDLILRVLSMYSDPAVRENEIKNMSQVYTALKGEVLPELRRARLIANVEYKNYTNDELLELLEQNADILDEEALLRAASVVDDYAKKVNIYKKAVERYGSDRAQYNLAVAYLVQGENALGELELNKVKSSDPDVLNAKGVMALRSDDLDTAESYFRKAAGNADAKANLGIIQILTGRYEEAAETLKDKKGCCNNTVLAYILTDQLDKAAAAVHCKDTRVQYLKAIIAARQGDAQGVKDNLANAFASDEWKARAARDVEFAGYEF